MKINLREQRTPLSHGVTDGVESVKDQSPEDVKRLTTPEYHKDLMEMARIVLSMTHKDPTPVIDAMVKSVITTGEPEHRYQVTDWFETVCLPVFCLPSEIVDGYFNLNAMKNVAKLWCRFNDSANPIYD